MRTTETSYISTSLQRPMFRQVSSFGYKMVKDHQFIQLIYRISAVPFYQKSCLAWLTIFMPSSKPIPIVSNVNFNDMEYVCVMRKEGTRLPLITATAFFSVPPANLNKKTFFFQVLGCIQQCSGVLPGSVLGNCFWWALETTCNVGGGQISFRRMQGNCLTCCCIVALAPKIFIYLIDTVIAPIRLL